MKKDKHQSQNEIIRIQKKRNNFVMLDKGFLEDDRLSFKAKGILAYLLSKPDNWRVIVRDLMNHAKDGRDAVYTGLNELKELGYYSKTPERNEKGVITHWDSVIYEDPTENPENKAFNPLTDFPDTAEPDTEMTEHNKNYRNNNNTYKKSKSLSKSDGNMTLTMTSTTDPRETHAAQNNKLKELPAPTTITSRTQESSITQQYTTFEEAETIIKSNVGYDIFLKERHTHIKQIDSIIFNAIEVLATAEPTIKIKQKAMSADFVKTVFMNLRHDHILYVLERFNNVTYPVVHKGSYIKTLLYTSLEEMELFYQNEYRKGNL